MSCMFEGRAMWPLRRAAAKARLQRVQKEEQIKRQGRMWLAAVAALMAGYILVTGQYISFGSSDLDEEDLDDGD